MKTKPKPWWMAAFLIAMPVDLEVRAASAPPETKPAPEKDWTLNVVVRYEVFSVDQDRAAEMRRGNPEDAKFYQELVAELPKGQIRQESLIALRLNNGQRATTESKFEMSFPMRYAPSSGDGVKEVPAPPVPILWSLAGQAGTAGEGLQVEAIVSDDQRAINLRLAPFHGMSQGTWKWGEGLSEVETPVNRGQSLHTMVIVRPDVSTLLGTVTPPSPDGAEPLDRRVWFSFVTASVVKP